MKEMNKGLMIIINFMIKRVNRIVKMIISQLIRYKNKVCVSWLKYLLNKVYFVSLVEVEWFRRSCIRLY